jgi:ankyrin repeat protein
MHGKNRPRTKLRGKRRRPDGSDQKSETCDSAESAIQPSLVASPQPHVHQLTEPTDALHEQHAEEERLHAFGEIVRLLIEKWTTVNSQDDVGLAPLHLAVTYNDYGACKMLLDAGASPLLCDVFGQSPLDVARLNGMEAIVHLLMSY